MFGFCPAGSTFFLPQLLKGFREFVNHTFFFTFYNEIRSKLYGHEFTKAVVNSKDQVDA